MTPDFFDIHSHINFNVFKNDGNEVIKRTLANGVWTILIGSQYDTSKRAVEYAEKYEQGIYAAIGLHPFHLIEQEIKTNDWELNGAKTAKTRPEQFSENKYLDLAKSKKVVAVGECGLDIKNQISNLKSQKYKNIQIETFEQQIELALKLNLPLIIHCRKAHNEILKILQKYKAKYGNKLRGNIHFFSGNYEEAKQYFDLDFSISFTGVITFTNDYDEVIKKSPLTRIMIETDSPYVTPAPHRGKRNEPLYVKEVARRIAEIKNLDLKEVSRATTENGIKMFLS